MHVRLLRHDQGMTTTCVFDQHLHDEVEVCAELIRLQVPSMGSERARSNILSIKNLNLNFILQRYLEYT